MKKITLFAALMVLVVLSTAFANPDDKNIKKGDFVLGQAAGFDFRMGTDTESDEDGDQAKMNYMSFGLNGYFGYFVIDGLELGPMLGGIYQRRVNADQLVTDDVGVTSERDVTTTQALYSAGAQIGYFMNASAKVAPYLMLNAGYLGGLISTDFEDFTDSGRVVGYTAGPKAGIDVFFTPAVAADFGLYFQYSSGKRLYDSDRKDVENAENDFSTMDYGLSFGVNVYF